MKKHPTRDLPQEYSLINRLDIRENRSLLIMNLWGVALLVVSWMGFSHLANWINPGSLSFSFSVIRPVDVFLNIGLILLVTLVMLVVHEGLHGLCFWLFTRSRPLFAFKGFYAYAAAPEWFLPKFQYLVTGFTPLVVITLGCIALMVILPAGWTPALFWMLVLNTSGSVGDLWMVYGLLRSPADVYARDHGDVLEFFSASKSPKI